MSRPLRVLLLCDRLDISGGVERFVCALGNHLVTEGMEVSIGSVSTPRDQVRYPIDPALNVLNDRVMPPSSAPTSKWGVLRAQWRSGRSLARLIRRDRPDVVVLNGLTTACSALLFAGRDARHIICCDHNHFGARSRLWQILRRWLYPRVGAVVSLTEADAPRFRALNPHTEVIYNATPLQADAPASPTGLAVLAVGRHVAQKGFDLLLAAWRLVVEQVPSAHLRIAGDGPLFDEHRRLARALGLDATVEWLAATPEIEALYRQAAVFVLSSRYEGMPLALLEAQALGVPAVAFDCPTGPCEVLTPHTGRLVPPQDVPGLARALVELLSSADLRERMGRAAIARSRDVFALRHHQRRWTSLIRDVAARSAAPQSS